MQQTFVKQIATVAILILLVISCKKNPANIEDFPREPIQTERGAAKGTPVTKSIGADGGTLVSADGNLTITVPQGAITTNEQFSIQPITNTLYGEDASRIAYRLLPEGITFSKPVQLQFRYVPATQANTTEDVLTIASQQTNGTWKVVPASLNKTTKTLTAETTHFSDWTVTGGFELKVEKPTLRPGEKSKLWVVSATDEDLLAPLSVLSEVSATLTALGNWKIIEGPGSISEVKSAPKGFAYNATYTAPSAVTGVKTAVITMEVEGFNKIKDPSVPGGIRHTGKMILFERIIISENAMTGTIDGVPFGFFGNDVVAMSQGGMIVIRGADASGEVTLSVHGNSGGAFPCGQIIMPGKAGVSMGPTDGSPFYAHAYFECGQTGDQKFSPSAVQIDKWPVVGQPAIGSFSGPVYLADGFCGARIKFLDLKFNVTRSN